MGIIVPGRPPGATSSLGHPMKTAIVCPIGHLDRMGYQNVARPCVQSMMDFADSVYLVQSMKGAQKLVDLLDDGCLHIIADERTWFPIVLDHSQQFSAHKVMDNCNVGLQAARDDGCDAAIILFCNNHIPKASREPLKEAMETMLEEGRRFLWYSRMDQLAGKLFHSSVAMPFIINLRIALLPRIACDAIISGDKTERMQRGNFSPGDYAAIADVQLEMTLPDLALKYNFIRCYSDLVPKRSPIFSWDGYWRKYYVEKFRKKQRSDAPLSPTGQRIAELSQPDYVSHEILEALGC